MPIADDVANAFGRVGGMARVVFGGKELKTHLVREKRVDIKSFRVPALHLAQASGIRY